MATAAAPRPARARRLDAAGFVCLTCRRRYALFGACVLRDAPCPFCGADGFEQEVTRAL